MKDTRRQYTDVLNAILGASGLAFNGSKRTPSLAQFDYSEHFMEAILRSMESKAGQSSKPASLLLESADTGTGKTLGYATPLLMHAAFRKATTDTAGLKQVGISTHTHALQAQFLGTPEEPGDLIEISGWLVKLGFPKLKIARRLGKQAFVSLSAVLNTINRLRMNKSELGLTADDFIALELMVDYAEAANNGQNDGLIEDIQANYGGILPCKLTAASVCLDDDSDAEDYFAYQRHLEVAHDADVLIMSHAYLASCAQYRNGQLSERGVDVLVVDEADRLAEVASSSFRSELSLRRVEAILKKIKSEHALGALKAFEDLTSFIQSKEVTTTAITLHELSVPKREHIVHLAENAKVKLDVVVKLSVESVGSEALESLQRSKFVLDRFITSAKKALNKTLDPENKAKDDGGIFASAISLSPVRSLPSLLVMPTNPGMVLSRLWSVQNGLAPLGCVLLTSATLGSPGRFPDVVKRFKSIANDLGVSVEANAYQTPELDLWSYFEPERFGAVRFILADPCAPSPTFGVSDEMTAKLNVEWIDYAVTMIQEAQKAGGRTLVLTCGYADSQLLSERLQAKGVNVIEQLRGQSTRDRQQEFLATQNSVWLTPTGWEGLNLPGQIANVVITRLPFRGANPADRALLASSGTLANKSVESILSARVMNNAKRKLRQGMFRGIRSIKDTSRIYIADPRFPLSEQSKIPLKYPSKLKYSLVRLYPALHSVIPIRFERAFANASVLKMDGSVLE